MKVRTYRKRRKENEYAAMQTLGIFLRAKYFRIAEAIYLQATAEKANHFLENGGVVLTWPR